jgi:hypothetical protein
MPESLDDKRKRIEAVQGFLNRMAMRAVAVPASERDAEFELIRKEFSESMSAFSINDKDFEQKFMGWLRDLVAVIEHSGGGKSGTA